MWRDWRPNEIEKELGIIKDLGMNSVRFFLFMPDFIKTNHQVEPLMLTRLNQFLDLCEQYQLYSLPSFIVGHMSGEDWDVDWRQNRNFITDPVLVTITQEYIRSVVNTTKHFQHIIAWVLSNELPNYIGPQKSDDVTAWVSTMVAIIKALDPDRPVCIGDGGWAPEIDGKQQDFQLREINQFQDFVGLHYYPRTSSSWHHTYTTAFRLRMAQEWSRPAIIEEFGTSTTLCSPENQALYYRSVFYSALINNSHGVLSWCLNDFDFENLRPYSHHTFEERFGILRTDHSIKPAGQEFKSFRNFLDSLESTDYQKVETTASLLIPSYYYYPYPYLFKPDFDKRYEFYLECFSLLKRANIELRCLFEPAVELNNKSTIIPDATLDPVHVPLLFAPRFKYLTKAFTRFLEQYVKNGGNLYFSFSHDSWILDWQKLAGVETDCKFGVPEFCSADKLDVIAPQEWQLFSKNEHFSMPLKTQHPEFSYCPILENRAEIILQDQNSHPVLIKNHYGQGTVYFMTQPIEMYALHDNNSAWKSALLKIYKSIYRETVSRDFILEGDGLEMGIWYSEAKHASKIVILNHAWSATEGKLTLNNKKDKIISCSIEYKKHPSSLYHFCLPRKGVCVFEIQSCTLD